MILLHAGASESVFVCGPRPQSILSTLPQSIRDARPSSSAPSPDSFALDTRDEILRLVDEALERHVRGLASLAALHQPTEPASAAASKPTQDRPLGEEAATDLAAGGFQVGDRVRLRPGRSGSSVAGRMPGAPNCGRCVSASGGTATPGPGAACPVCRVCIALGMRQMAVDSDRCLGPHSAGREGVVEAVERAPAEAGGGALVRVLSLRSGTACLYAPDDLLYADCSVPGPRPRVPFVGPAAPPPDWEARCVARIWTSAGGGSGGMRTLLDFDPGALRRGERGRAEGLQTEFVIAAPHGHTKVSAPARPGRRGRARLVGAEIDEGLLRNGLIGYS